jgi:hypothetical protein
MRQSRFWLTSVVCPTTALVTARQRTVFLLQCLETDVQK